MFYCEDCRKAKNWPTSIARSGGRCELCGDYRNCYDRKSFTLPKETHDETIDFLKYEKKYIDEIRKAIADEIRAMIKTQTWSPETLGSWEASCYKIANLIEEGQHRVKEGK